MTDKNPYLTNEVAPVGKTAGGLSVYLMEELSDARLNCQRLKAALADVMKMVEESTHRDHFFEVAGHLIEAIPAHLLKLEKSLDATALAAGKMDYDETIEGLSPEKVEELEGLVDDVRLGPTNRPPVDMTPKQAADRLSELARHVEKTGNLDAAVVPLLTVLHSLSTKVVTASDSTKIARLLREQALDIEFSKAPKKSLIASRLREVLAAVLPSDPSMLLAMMLVGSSREKVIDGFKSANPALSDEQLETIADHWEANKNVVKERSSSEDENPYLLDTK